MTYAVYAPRVPAHPTRTGVYRGTDVLIWLVLHTSQGGEMPTSAEALARFIAGPRSATNLASYNYILDTDSVIPIVPDDTIAFAQGGANTKGLSACYPGLAEQTREQWFDANSSLQHEQCARWLADKSVEYSIPLRIVTPAEMRADVPGVCDHNAVRLAFGRTTHRDVGPNFPFEWVINRANQLLNPQQKDEEMPALLIAAHDDGHPIPVFAWGDNYIYQVRPMSAAMTGSGSVGVRGGRFASAEVDRTMSHEDIQWLINSLWTGGWIDQRYLQPKVPARLRQDL